MQISDEELIAYLLDDADSLLRARIEACLAVDESLRDRLRDLRMMLGQLDSLQLAHTPPPDLLARTLARIDAQAPADFPEAEPQELPTLTQSHVAASAEARRRPLWDSTALMICSAVLLSLFLPTVLRARYESRKAQCAFNLHSVGNGLVELAQWHPQHRFPSLAIDGPESFAGVYSVRLSDAGAIESPEQLLCASLSGCRPYNRERLEMTRIPSMKELLVMSGQQLELCQKLVGGDFAYNLGVIEEENRVVAPRCEGRSYFAILADAPLVQQDAPQWIAHDGRGINIFFEDGHVAFVKVGCLQETLPDDPFCNVRNVREVGLNKHDASLGPSYFRPFGN